MTLLDLFPTVMFLFVVFAIIAAYLFYVLNDYFDYTILIRITGFIFSITMLTFCIVYIFMYSIDII